MGLFGGGSDKAGRIARAQWNQEQARRKKIEEGTERVRQMFSGQFTDDFYKGVEQDYTDYYQPYLDRQVKDAREGLSYNLSNAGLFGRSAKGEQKFGDLQIQADQQQVSLADRARQQAAQRRAAVQAAQNNVILQLQTTGDAEGAAADAANQAQIATARPEYEPLGQLFTDVSAGIATQADLERRGESRYRTGLFNQGSGSSSGEVIG